MFECKIENSKGEIITLTQNESNFQVTKIDGLNPPNAKLNMTSVAGMDGARFNSAKLETRNVVIYVKLNNNIEENRIMLYRYFATKEWCKFYYKNEHRDVFVEGYIQSVEVTPFSNSEIMQISMICPQPYFKDIDEIIDNISKILSAFKFPFSINYNAPLVISTFDANRVSIIKNNSESETGVLIEINVLGDINKIHIRNTVTGESMIINDSNGFTLGDVVIINTNRGEKSVSLLRNGVKSNIFSKLQSGFSFFQLELGNNRFSYQIDNGANDTLVNIKFKHRTMYRGI